MWLHDSATTVFGSSNWSTASDDNQLEANLFTTDLDTWTALQDVFVRKWTNAAPGGIQETEPFLPIGPDKPVNVSPADGAAAVGAAGAALTWNAGSWGSELRCLFRGHSRSRACSWLSRDLTTATAIRTFALPTPLDWKLHVRTGRLSAIRPPACFRAGAP